jgi:hypothetical protein
MQKMLTAMVDEVFGADRPADLELIIREGYPAAVLRELGEGALMVVVGTRGHGGFAGLLLGFLISMVTPVFARASSHRLAYPITSSASAGVRLGPLRGA